MPSLNALKLSNKPLGDQAPDFDAIPAERGSFTPPPQPGSYRFRLPATIDNFDVITTNDHGERINVIFDSDAPLVIVQSKGEKHNGESYQTRLSNVPRARGKEKILVSDLDYLIKALQEGAGQTPRKPKSNMEYAKVLQGFAGKEFGADQEFSYSCNPNRAARFRDDTGQLQTSEDPESTLGGDDAGLKAGCGARYYQNNVPKVDGQQPLEIECSECGATVRAFGNLRNFKP